MTEILGYHTANTMEALAAFMGEVLAQYEALEQAIAPIDEKVEGLQKDWEPRPLSFWSEVLQTGIAEVRQATATCLGLFDKKRSHERAVPLIICATSISYTGDLHYVKERLEEAGILLTAYLHTSARTVSVEQHIRERQRMMRALQEVSEAVHEAVDKGRVTLKSAPEEQRRLFGPLPCLRVVKDQPYREE